MKFTKKQKQWMLGGVVALVLAGGGTAVVVNHHAQVQADKIAQEEKAAYAKLLKTAQEATEKAETFKAESDVKTAQDAIKKLKENDKTELIARVEKVRQNWELVNKATKNVASAEKAKSDATVQTAQTTINQLKAEMAQAKKTALQKRLDKVKAEIKAKKDKAAAEKKSQEAAAQQMAQDSQAPAQTVAQNNGAQASSGNAGVAQAETPTANGGAAYSGYAQAPSSVPAQNNSGYVASAPSGGSAQAPAQPQQSTGNPAYNSGAGANANPNVSIEEGNKWIENANAHPGGFESANGGR